MGQTIQPHWEKFLILPREKKFKDLRYSFNDGKREASS